MRVCTAQVLVHSFRNTRINGWSRSQWLNNPATLLPPDKQKYTKDEHQNAHRHSSDYSISTLTTSAAA
jgi:hypothetical protein